jgi:hypothetical protein
LRNVILSCLLFFTPRDSSPNSIRMPCFPITHGSVRVTVRKIIYNLVFEGLFRDSYDMYMNMKICNCYKLYGNVNTAGVSKFCVRAS